MVVPRIIFSVSFLWQLVLGWSSLRLSVRRPLAVEPDVETFVSQLWSFQKVLPEVNSDQNGSSSEGLSSPANAGCPGVCGYDNGTEACAIQCEDLRKEMCGNACDRLCAQDTEKSPSCEEDCSELQVMICAEGVTLSEAVVEQVRPGATVDERREGSAEDTPEPIDKESPLWERALDAWKRSIHAINTQRQNLSMPSISVNSTELMHAWVKVEKDEGFKLCTRMKLAGEIEFVTIDIVAATVTSVHPTQLVFGNDYAYHTLKALEEAGAGASLDEDSGTQAIFPCNPSFTKLLQASRSRLGLARGHGVSEGIAGRAYIGGDEALPEAYSTREAWPMCNFPVRDQGDCGACYAFAATVLADTRLCIAHQKKASSPLQSMLLLRRERARRREQHLANRSSGALMLHSQSSSNRQPLTPQELVSCGSADRPELHKPYCTIGPGGTTSRKYSQGCNGGSTFDALYYAHVYGLPTEECVPYVSGGGSFMDHFKDFVNLLVGKVPLCSALESKACHAGRAQHKLHRPEVIASGDIQGIMRAIYETGPVYASLSAYDDFMHSYPQGFSDDVYTVRSGAAYLGGHAVVLEGWGKTEAGVPYWHGENSWGASWGLEGFFKIRRGTNEAGLEENVHFARAFLGTEDDAPDVGSKCISVAQRGGGCTLINTCEEEVRRVKVTYLGSEENCGSWTSTIPEVYPGETQKVSLNNAHVCTVIEDTFVKKFDSQLHYQDVTSQYPGYSCVLHNTYAGRGVRKRWCGNSYVSLASGGTASVSNSMCEAGCQEIYGQSVFETTE